MANKRYDISTPRAKRDGGTYWVKIGTAFENEKGIQLIFDALPLPDKEGRCSASLFEPREREAPRQPASSSFKRDDADLDDDVPF
jgi:hypothetical protein